MFVFVLDYGLLPTQSIGRHVHMNKQLPSYVGFHVPTMYRQIFLTGIRVPATFTLS